MRELKYLLYLEITVFSVGRVLEDHIGKLAAGMDIVIITHDITQIARRGDSIFLGRDRGNLRNVAEDSIKVLCKTFLLCFRNRDPRECGEVFDIIFREHGLHITLFLPHCVRLTDLHNWGK